MWGWVPGCFEFRWSIWIGARHRVVPRLGPGRSHPTGSGSPHGATERAVYPDLVLALLQCRQCRFDEQRDRIEILRRGWPARTLEKVFER